jgi:tyrosyl-tRNA synthetase
MLILLSESCAKHTNSAEDLARKVKKAYCPPLIVENNPVLDYCKHILFGYFGEVSGINF